MSSLRTWTRPANGACGRWKTCVQEMRRKLTTPPCRGRAFSRRMDAAAGVRLHAVNSVTSSPSSSPATIMCADREEDEEEQYRMKYTLGELIQQEEMEPMVMAEIESRHFSCSSSFSFPRMESEWIIDSPVMMVDQYEMLEKDLRDDHKEMESEWIIDSPVMMVDQYEMLEKDLRDDHKDFTTSLSSDVEPATLPTPRRRRIFWGLRKKPIKHLFPFKFSLRCFLRQPFPKDHKLLSKEMEMAKKILLLLSDDVVNAGSSIDHKHINSTENEIGDKEIVSIEELEEMDMLANFRIAELELEVE